MESQLKRVVGDVLMNKRQGQAILLAAAAICLLIMLQGCGGGAAMICQGSISNIPEQHSHEVDSLTVTLKTSQGVMSRRIPLQVQPETGSAPFQVGTGLLKSLFPGTALVDGDTLSISLEKTFKAIVRVSSYRNTEAGVLDSLVLNEFNFDIGCDRLIQRFDTLGLVEELHFVKSFDMMRVAPYSVTIGHPGPTDNSLTLPVEVVHSDSDLPCGYDPFKKYKPD